jgi:hypothetical protein
MERDFAPDEFRVDAVILRDADEDEETCDGRRARRRVERRDADAQRAMVSGPTAERIPGLPPRAQDSP